MKKFFFAVAGLAAMVLALVASSPSPALAATFLQPANPAQGFNPSFMSCIGGTAPNPNAALTSCGGGENLLLGDAPAIENAVRIPGGTRQTLAFAYTGPGWRTSKEGGGGAITFPSGVGTGGCTITSSGETGTCGPQEGGLKSTVDLFCNGNIDIFADPLASTPGDATTRALDDPGWAIAKSHLETVSWGPLTGTTDQPDESFLDKALPPTTIMSRNFRVRALATKIFVGVSGTTIDPGAPINQINVTPSWSPKANLQATFLAGAISSPSTSKNCLDSPQNSITKSPGGTGGVGGGVHCQTGCTGLTANPVRAGADVGADGIDDNSGLYARWTVFVSAADTVNGELQGVIAMDCKWVSANAAGTAVVAQPGGADADGDCLQSSGTAEPGRSGFVDPNDSVADMDGDGIPDGVEVAWGSCPDNTFVFNTADHGFNYDCQYLNGVSGATRTLAQARDTDQDGRSDLEELLANGVNLSNPRVADTDGDGVTDGGIAWDKNNDGIPDNVMAAGSSETLLNGAGCPAAPCTGPKVNTAFEIPGPTFKAFEGDNCTNIANADQANSDSNALPFTSTTLIALAYPPDRTNPDEDSMGDACDADNDNDGMVDAAELTNNWITGFPAKACDSVSEGGNAPAHTNPAKRDSDNDGTLDGEECQAGTNPAVSGAPGTFNNAPLDQANGCGGASLLEACSPVDGDSLGPKSEAIYRTTGINQAEGSSLSCGSGQLCNIDANYVASGGNRAGDANNGGNDGDSDADGVLDSYEALIWGTSPANMDTDGDGCADGVEIVDVAGTAGKVESGDFSAMLLVWNKSRVSPGGTYEPLIDYNGSGKIEAGDFSILLDLWNKSCAPGSVLEP